MTFMITLHCLGSGNDSIQSLKRLVRIT